VILSLRKMKTCWKVVMIMQKCPTKDGDLMRRRWSANVNYDSGMNRGELLLITHEYH